MKSEFSPLIAGTMTWGTWGKNLSVSEMSAMMKICLDCGFDTFDHADIYGGYTTEDSFGQAFANSGVPRNEIKLISKCGIQYLSDKSNFKVKHYEYSKSHIIDSVETSLKNLRTDYLDLLLLHRPSPLMEPDKISEAITELKTAGKIVDFGVSNFTVSQMDLLKHLDMSVNQIQFSITAPDAMTDGTLDYMISNGIMPMAWNPLGSVFRDDTPQSTRIKNVLLELMVKYEAPADVILMAWILKHPAGIRPVFGTVSADRIRELPKALSISMETEDWFLLWVESRGVKVP